MRLFRAAMLLGLAAVMGVSSGCARWTLLPKSAPPIPQPGEQPRHRTSLLEAAGLKRPSEEQKDSVAYDPKLSNDLAQLDPALALARLAERQGSPSEARRQYERFIERNPNHPLPHHRLGVMAAREAKYDQAEAHFQMAGRLARPTAELLSDMGYLYYLQDRLGEAEHMLRQATELEPANSNANNNLGLVLAARGSYDHSLQQFRRVNGEAEARANLAYTHSQRGDLNKSREEYLRALTLDKTLSNAAQALVQVEEARKREDIAMAKFAEAAGDELISANEAPQTQPYYGEGQRNGPSANNQPMNVAHAQPNYPQPPQQTAAYQDVQQASKTSYRAPVAQDKFQQQAQLLMPIPQPPVASKAEYPTGNVAYPDTGVQQASHVQQVSHVEPASQGEATSRFTNQRLAFQPVENQRPTTNVNVEPHAVTPVKNGQWEDAWQNLSAPTGGEGVQQPKRGDDSQSSGVRISIGG